MIDAATLIDTIDAPADSQAGSSATPSPSIPTIAPSSALTTAAELFAGESARPTKHAGTIVSPSQRRTHQQVKSVTRVIPLQTWEGFVQEITSETFRASLHDLTIPGPYQEEEAEFYLEDVRPDDLDLVRPGAIFRWIIGYRENVYGTRERISSVVFRRLPTWSENDIRAAFEVGKARADALRWE